MNFHTFVVKFPEINNYWHRYFAENLNALAPLQSSVIRVNTYPFTEGIENKGLEPIRSTLTAMGGWPVLEGEDGERGR